MRILYFILFFTITLTSCHFIQDKKEKPKTSKGDTQVIKNYYKNGGSLKSEITVKNKKKHGPAKKYYTTGELHTLVHYKNNVREGEAIWYYRNGKPYRVTNFVKGKKEGIRKVFYKNGNLQAEVPYKDDNLQEGTKEYNEDGSLKENKRRIVINSRDLLAFESKYILELSLSKPARETMFYQERVSTTGKKMLVPLITKKGKASIEFYLTPNDFKMETLTFFAEYQTKLRTPVLIKKTYNLAIENR